MAGVAPPIGSQLPRRVSTRPNNNPFTPPIPAPTTDVNNLRACVEALKASTESLIGQRGDASNRAVTFRDLIGFGVLSPAAVQSPSGSAPGAGGGGGSSGVPFLPLAGGVLTGTLGQTMSVTSSSAIVSNVTGSGSSTPPSTYIYSVGETFQTGSNFYTMAHYADQMNSGGTGHRVTLDVDMTTGFGGVNHFYVPLQTNAVCTGGSGAFIGANPTVTIGASAASTVLAAGLEVDTLIQRSSVANKIGIKIADVPGSIGIGSAADAALVIDSDTSAVGYLTGILIGSGGGSHGVKTTGTLFTTAANTFGSGIDLGSATFTNNAFVTKGISIDGSGAATQAITFSTPKWGVRSDVSVTGGPSTTGFGAYMFSAADAVPLATNNFYVGTLIQETMNSGGTGCRLALDINMQTGYGQPNQFYVGVQPNAICNGGSGYFEGANPTVTINASAVSASTAACVIEADILLHANVVEKIGVQIVDIGGSTGVGSFRDVGLCIENSSATPGPSSVGFQDGIKIGSFPAANGGAGGVKPTGTLFNTGAFTYATGIDLSHATLTTAFVSNGFSVSGVGGVVLGAPTGGNKGAGTLNATGLFVNNVPVITGSSGLSGMVAGQLPIAASATTITSSTASLAASFMPAYTGDVTSPAGSTVNTLPVVNSNIGTWNNITINAKGLATAGSNVAYLTAVPAYTGDVTSAAGGTVNTLATVNANVGTFQGLTVNAKGLVTAAVNQSYATVAQLGNYLPLAGGTLSGDLTVNGTAGGFSVAVTSPNTAGSSDGLYVSAGTNASDWMIYGQNAPGTAGFTVRGDGLANFTGSLGVGGSTTLGGTLVVNGANARVNEIGAGDVQLQLGSNARTANGNVYLDFKTNTTNSLDFRIIRLAGANANTTLQHGGTGQIQFAIGGTTVAIANNGVFGAPGFQSRSGFSGPAQGNAFNLQWTGAAFHLWVDTVDTGVITVSSDYRIKENVVELPSTWEMVKALRPISYTIRGNAELKTVADPLERWGFVAHELQETLIQSAANGYKDAPNCIQSPNLSTVVAALARALQEAMARIEILEGAVA
jgi:hypothetical protein